jgi:hypothetical protein
LAEAPSVEHLFDVLSVERFGVVASPAPAAVLESPEGIRSRPLFVELSFVRAVMTWAKT